MIYFCTEPSGTISLQKYNNTSCQGNVTQVQTLANDISLCQTLQVPSILGWEFVKGYCGGDYVNKSLKRMYGYLCTDANCQFCFTSSSVDGSTSGNCDPALSKAYLCNSASYLSGSLVIMLVTAFFSALIW